MVNPTDLGWTLSTRRIVNYEHCNQLGNLFGGMLLAWLDEAASIFCRRAMDHALVVTKTLDSMVFHTPTRLGETVCLYCRINKVGRSSLTVDMLVTNHGYGDQEEREIATTSMVWVALDEQGKPFIWKKNKDLKSGE